MRWAIIGVRGHVAWCMQLPLAVDPGRCARRGRMSRRHFRACCQPSSTGLFSTLRLDRNGLHSFEIQLQNRDPLRRLPYNLPYKERHKTENMFGQLKDRRRIHTRDDRCAHT